jgi:tRNA U34 5-carboxymethylaminomethyl modifying GTPase MnmE/TrmE
MDTPTAFEYFPHSKAGLDENNANMQIMIVVTEADLTEGERVSEAELGHYAKDITAPWCIVSARTMSGMDHLTGMLIEKAKAMYLAEKEDVVLESSTKRSTSQRTEPRILIKDLQQHIIILTFPMNPMFLPLFQMH